MNAHALIVLQAEQHAQNLAEWQLDPPAGLS